MYFLLPSMTSMSWSELQSSLKRTSALKILYSCRIICTSFSSMRFRGTVELKEMPPAFFCLK